MCFFFIRTHRASSRNLVSTNSMHSSTCDSILTSEDIVLLAVLSASVLFCSLCERILRPLSRSFQKGIECRI